LPKVDRNKPFVPSWAANRVLPVPPPGGSSADWWDDDMRGRESPPRRDEREIMIELD
jgi:hypothetical protein